MTVAERMKLAIAASSRGDFAQARREAEAALKAQPNSPGILQLLGVIYCQTGDLARGVDHLRNAIRRGADTRDNRLNLARALVELGRFDEAEALCLETEAADGGGALRRMRADIMKAQGSHLEAIELYEQIVAAAPGDFESWNNLGNSRCELGELIGGVAALERARALKPDSAVIHINLGRALAGLGRDEESLDSFAHAAQLAPQDATAMRELGSCLQRMGRSSEALAPLGSAARLDPRNPDTFVTLGLAFVSLADRVQAERSFRFAIRADPACAPAYLNLAVLLEQSNQVDELQSLARSAGGNGIARDELDYIEALLLRREGRLDEALSRASGAFPASLDPAIKSLFIGQVADRLGDAGTAFAAFADMNRITASYPEARVFDGTEHRRFVEELAAATTRGWIDSWVPAEPTRAGPAPIFLAGFLRSGTTLLDTMLMGHPALLVLEEEPILAQLERSGGDLVALASLDGEAVDSLRGQYFRQVEAVEPPSGRLVVDKNPLASLRAPLIHRIFPDARFIFALRHPCDVVLSCFMQNFRVNQAMASFLDLENAALFYDRVMRYWMQCRELLPLNVHTVRYEDLVEDVEGEMRPLLGFLDLPWDEKILHHQKTAADRGYIRTPSYAQVTEQVYARASGRWLRYRSQLTPVIPILAPWVERFGYSTAELSPA